MSLDQLKLDIKQRAISDVIGHYLPLTRRGSQTLALCPFHQDSKPSLNVNDQRGMFMCFACNTGGDHITFVEKYKNLSFKESLEEIAGILNFDFDSYHQQAKKNPEKEMATKILKKAIQIYQKIAERTPEKMIFDQFIKDRKIKADFSEKFQLCFAPKGNILTQYLNSIPNPKDRNFAIQVAEKIKLIRRDKSGEHFYDTFRERIMFPIWDHYGNPIGFTSRSTKEGQQPKYLNSTESFIFQKKRLLYAIHHARSAIRERDQIILCEGNMDALMMHQFGFTNTVAIMGTGFNEDLVKVISSLTKNVIFALDSDGAGLTACERMNEFFLKEGITGKYLNFGDHKDPDEFLNNSGLLAMSKLIDDAPLFIDFQLQNLKNSSTGTSTDAKIETLHQCFKILSPLGSSIYTMEKATIIARELGLQSSAEQIQLEFKKYLGQQNPPKPVKQNKNNDLGPLPENLGPMAPEPVTQVVHYPKIIEILIREIIKYPELMEKNDWPEVLDLLWIDEVKTLFNAFNKLFLEVDDLEFAPMALDLLNQQDLPIELKSVVGAAVYKYEKLSISEKESNSLLVNLRNRLRKEVLLNKRNELLKTKLNLLPAEQGQEVLQALTLIQQQIKNLNTEPKRN